MDYHTAFAIAVPIITLFGGWIVSVERRFAELVSIKQDVAENRDDVKDIYKHLLGRESSNGSSRQGTRESQ